MEIKLNFQWRRQTGPYQQGYDLFLNRIRIGFVSWNDSMSRDLPADKKAAIRYVGGSYMLSDKRWYGTTPEEVETLIEKDLVAWFTEALKEARIQLGGENDHTATTPTNRPLLFMQVDRLVLE
jgi:hypothetical protein